MNTTNPIEKAIATLKQCNEFFNNPLSITPSKLDYLTIATYDTMESLKAYGRSQHVADGGWRDISEAPKDGTTVFAENWKTAQRGMVHFNSQGEWELVNGLTNLPMGIGFYPTHFRDLPAAPQPPAEQEGV